MTQKINRVFFIGLDGAGNFIKDTDTPNIHKLLENGVLTYTAKAVFPSISGECWGSILHGVLPEKHGLNNDVVEEERFPADSPFPSFLKAVREVYSDAKLAAFSEWSPINKGIIEENIGCHKVSLDDDELALAASDYIIENPDVKAMFIQFNNPDYAGHQYGYGTEPYLQSITDTDRNVGVVIDAIKQAGLLDDSLIIITSDHGGGGDAGFYTHGSNHPKDMTVFWGCHGPGIDSNMELKELCHMDTAAVVLKALDITPPKEWDAKVPIGLFE